jgi:hypothetical protein
MSKAPEDVLWSLAGGKLSKVRIYTAELLYSVNSSLVD